MSSTHRQNKNGRGHVENIQWHIGQTHESFAPGDGNNRRDQRQDQALHGAESFVVNHADDADGNQQQHAAPAGKLLQQSQEGRVAGDDDVDTVVALCVYDFNNFVVDVGEAAFAFFQFSRCGVAHLGQDSDGFEVFRNNGVHISRVSL